MKFGRGAALYEGDVESVEGTDGTAEQRRWRLTYHVKRPQELGGNLRGNCSGVSVTRSDTLVIHEEDGKRRFVASGTWTDCVTETRRGPGVPSSDPSDSQ